MNEELAYSIHLGSDKNRTNKAKEIAKTNPSETTSFSKYNLLFQLTNFILLNKLFEPYLNFKFLNSIEPFIFLMSKSPYVSLENDSYVIISNTLWDDTFPSANFSLISEI